MDKGVAKLLDYADITTPGSERMINYLRWSAMEAINHAYRRRLAAGLSPFTEENMPRDYWIKKTKEIAVEKILKDFPGEGVPESLYIADADVIKNAIDETIKIYGKIPYIDEPEYRKKVYKKFLFVGAFISAEPAASK